MKRSDPAKVDKAGSFAVINLNARSILNKLDELGQIEADSRAAYSR